MHVCNVEFTRGLDNCAGSRLFRIELALTDTLWYTYSVRTYIDRVRK